MDLLPPEQPRIDRPGARSDHRQNGAEDRLYNGNPRIAGMRGILQASDPNLNDGCKRSRHWSPQTDQKKYSRADSDRLQDDHRQRSLFTQVGDPKIEERSPRKQPLEQKTYAGPTIRERRE